MGAAGKEKEQKVKRRPGRVPTSCAECRRLKLRCDRNVPCGKCVSRGCAAICPDGELASVKGSRMVLSGTEELHERIAYLCGRIRELENALRTMQEATTDDPHPLLRLELVHSCPDKLSPSKSASPPTGTSSSGQSRSPQSSLRSPPQRVRDLTNQLKPEDENSVIDAFGTLTIGQYGVTSFIGKTARSEFLIHAPKKEAREDKVFLPRLSERMASRAFECEISDLSLGREAFSLLPPLSEAIRLCEIYQEQGKSLYTSIPRVELFDNILMKVYRAESFETFDAYHSLALLFIVFALATLFDTNRPPCAIEAHEYYYVSRISLGFLPPIAETTLESIQTLVRTIAAVGSRVSDGLQIHIAQYLDLSDRDSHGASFVWMYIGTAVRLGHKIGLHLNSARWKLADAEVKRRTRLYWQLFTLDTWASFYYGRPPSMAIAYADCPLPQEAEDTMNPTTEKEPDYSIWNWKYALLVHSVVATAFGAKQPAYKTILDLDRKVRDFYVPEQWRPICSQDGSGHYEMPHMPIRRWLVLWAKESTLLNLHRTYFAQALHEQPADMSKHRYIPSVIAMYRSAWRIMTSLRLAWEDSPHIAGRLNLAWSQALSAAIAMCLLITKAPGSSLSPAAMEELNTLAELFEEAAPSSPSASKLLPSLQRLQRKAHEAAGQSHSQDDSSITPAELDRLGGKTHLVSQPIRPTSEVSATFDPTMLDRSRGAPSRSTSVTLSDSFAVDQYPPSQAQNLHPTIAEDIRNFGLGGPSNFASGQTPFYDIPTEVSDIQGQPFEFRQEDMEVLEQYFPAAQQGYAEFPQQAPLLPQVAPPPIGMGFGDGGLVLDATWQSFVEQLGF
ncbi:hypothetical protein BDQ12DRAFT_710525 [Crucibulum laeve]|uniref:Zn(2)-C6 fungal-type domain-containing protein n=1 Tax=Crucibulum laeve TaxID=68775 RepID=A0A5C3MC02_9AGAR|nr:hypothetical protein BDQ12DRAFT_710525 [Crucibulum laeve]